MMRTVLRIQGLLKIDSIRYLAGIVLALVIGAGSASENEDAGAGANACAFTIDDFKDKNGSDIQNALFYIYRDNVAYRTDRERSGALTDGSVGHTTVKWLNAFCESYSSDAGVESVDTLIEALFRYADIALRYPMSDRYLYDEGHVERLSEIDQTLQTLRPIKWNGGDCGCAPQAVINGFPNFIYGFYPFWLAQTVPSNDQKNSDGEGQAVDFSVLTRVGYYALPVDKQFTIPSRLHWQKANGYADFVDTAHKYRTKIDLVIYDADWEKWQQSTAVQDDYRIDKLLDQVDDYVKEKLTNYPINLMKPYLSLGTSPVRTLGDGVTVDFDFQGIPREKRDMVFERVKKFIVSLKKKLDSDQEKDDKGVAKVNDTYFLNVMVPISQIADGNGIYTLSHLAEMVKNVNIFLVVLDSQADPLRQLKTLRLKIDDLETETPEKNTEISEALLEKIVPVLEPDKIDAGIIDNSFRYANWNYSGIGLWPLPLNISADDDSNINDALRTRFLEDGDAEQPGSWLQAGRHVEESFCNVLCPQRWWLRIVLFALFVVGLLIVAIVYYILPTFFCRLNKLFSGGGIFVVFFLSGVYFFVVGLSLWCDPWWNQHQGIVLIAFIAALLLILVGRYFYKRKEKAFP